VTSVILSQISLFACWGVCVLLVPTYLFERNEGGVSNFGVHAATVVPYSLAFLLSGFFVLRAARAVVPVDDPCRRFRAELHVLACLLLIVLTSTYAYKANALLHGVHVAAGVTITCFESLASVWMVAVVVRTAVAVLLLGAQLIGFTVAALTLFGTVHLLFAAQLLTSLAFGLLLIAASLAVQVRVSAATS
jgi:hypothetical protein